MSSRHATSSSADDVESLKLEALGLTPEKTARELGTIPKVIRPRTTTATTEETTSATEKGTSASAATGKKKRSNRRQRRRKTLEENVVEKVQGLSERNTLADDEFKAASLALEMHDVEEDEELKHEKEETAASRGEGAARKPGSRRRRTGKRKKQVSPDPKLSSDKENDKEDEDVEEDDDEDQVPAGGEGRKFLWRSVTKNGWIKKCILVDGLVEGGRPKVGDTVLVKSQGKLKDGRIIDDFPTLVFNVGEHEVIEGLEIAVQSMYKNELSILSVKPEMAYGQLGRKTDIPAGARITYLFGLLHFERQKEISQLTWAQRRKSGQSRMRLANWWYQRKEYPVAVKCYKRALEYYNNIPSNQECSSPEEYRELLQLMEERLRVMRQVANIFKRIANMIQSGQISSSNS